MKIFVNNLNGENNTKSIIEVMNGKQLSFNLENDAVREFRTNVRYNKNYIVVQPTIANLESKPTGILPYLYMRNQISSAEDTGVARDASWTEWTRPVIISGTTAGNILHLVSNTHSQDVNCENGATLVYNLIPGQTYNWSESNTSRIGTFITEGTIRMIKIPLWNFRDIGGYPCYDSNGNKIGTINYGQLFRGMGYCSVGNGAYDIYTHENNSSVAQILHDIGVTVDLDLRTAKTTTSKNKAINPGYPTIGGKTIEYYQREIISYNYKSSPNTNCTYNGVVGSKRAAYLNLIDCLNKIAGAGNVCYAHCATGADRTGVLIAIIMALLGCSLEDIVKEYELTSLSGFGYVVNLGYKRGDGTPGGTTDSGNNIRNFLYSFNTSSTTTDISIVNAIVDWVKSLTRTDGVSWNDYISLLKTKMIKYN